MKKVKIIKCHLHGRDYMVPGSRCEYGARLKV